MLLNSCCRFPLSITVQFVSYNTVVCVYMNTGATVVKQNGTPRVDVTSSAAHSLFDTDSAGIPRPDRFSEHLRRYLFRIIGRPSPTIINAILIFRRPQTNAIPSRTDSVHEINPGMRRMCWQSFGQQRMAIIFGAVVRIPSDRITTQLIRLVPFFSPSFSPPHCYINTLGFYIIQSEFIHS